MARAPRYRRRRLAAALLLAPLWGCVPRARVDALEAEIAALRQQVDAAAAEPDFELRLQSATVAIEKDRDRIDQIVPPDAQWLRLELGQSLRWYVDPQVDTVYVLFQALDRERATVELTLSTTERQTTHRMHPGESIEERLGADDAQRAIVLTLHRLKHQEGGASEGLFSVVAAPQTR